jgi:signal transduction histidine kinase
MASMSVRARLWPRLLLSHITLATIPALIIGLLLITTARQSIENTVSEGNFEVARRASNEIRLYIEQAQYALQQVADNMGIMDATPLERQKLIDNMVVRHDQFHELSVLDLEGLELYTTRLDGRLNPLPRKDIQLPAPNEVAISQVFIAAGGLPMVSITVPTLRFNQMIGYITADVHLKDMWNLVDSVRIGPGRTIGYGYAYVVSSRGRMIAHPQRERVYRQEDISSTVIGQALKKRESGTLIYETPQGEMIATYCPVDPLGWGVVIEQPTAQAFVRSQEMKWEISLLMVISAIMASLIGIFFARKIARPIHVLVEGVKLLGQGKLTSPITVPGAGEHALLASEFNNMTSKLREKERQLQRAERLATLSKFAAILSHEIRNPLNAMVINLQILKREMEKQPERSNKSTQYFERVMSEIWRIDGLVENFLAYARPPALNTYPHDINAIISEMTDVYQETARERGVVMNRRFEQPTLMASVDANQLKQVFLNLMLNAIDAMESGGELTIATGIMTPPRNGQMPADLPSDHRYVTVSFTDTGCGITPEQMEHIFDVYYTSKSAGNGLGLSIAGQIVEKHGGKVEVTSVPDQGSTFTVWLPILSDAGTDASRNKPDRAVPAILE